MLKYWFHNRVTIRKTDRYTKRQKTGGAQCRWTLMNQHTEKQTYRKKEVQTYRCTDKYAKKCEKKLKFTIYFNF